MSRAMRSRSSSVTISSIQRSTQFCFGLLQAAKLEFVFDADKNFLNLKWFVDAAIKNELLRKEMLKTLNYLDTIKKLSFS